MRTTDFEIRLRAGLEALERADTIIVPGIADIDAPVPRELVQALRAAAERGARLASICSGAFLLAATGLLAGKRATTHWLAAAELARRYPAIEVDPNVLFVDEGNLLTSAGATAGIDLCLHLVRRDFGAAVAANTARMAVVALEREGGQAQFIVHPPPPSDGESLAPLLAWIEQNLHRDLSLFALARRAAMSTRTLSPPLPRADRDDARAVGDARAGAAGATAARDDRARGGACGETSSGSPRPRRFACSSSRSSGRARRRIDVLSEGAGPESRLSRSAGTSHSASQRAFSSRRQCAVGSEIHGRLAAAVVGRRDRVDSAVQQGLPLGLEAQRAENRVLLVERDDDEGRFG